METETLTPEQIGNWRRIIAFRLNQMSPGAGIYANFMPESEVIKHWRMTKAILETPSPEAREPKRFEKKVCTHSNSITGQNGKYCLDCEKHV